MNSRKFELVLPEEWHDAIESVGSRTGETKAEVVRRALLEMFPNKVRKQLPEVKNGRPKGK